MKDSGGDDKGERGGVLGVGGEMVPSDSGFRFEDRAELEVDVRESAGGVAGNGV